MAWMTRGATVLVLAGPLPQEGRDDLVQVFGGGYGQGVGGQQFTYVPK
jgi:hypothetical protein